MPIYDDNLPTELDPTSKYEVDLRYTCLLIYFSTLHDGISIKFEAYTLHVHAIYTVIHICVYLSAEGNLALSGEKLL